MREWTDLDTSMSAGGYLSSSDGYCPAEQLQYYVSMCPSVNSTIGRTTTPNVSNMLGDPLGFPFQDADLQALPYGQQQYGSLNVPFSLYGSPSSSSSTSSSTSSSNASSQPYHPSSYSYSPHCLEAPCDASPEPLQCVGPGLQGSLGWPLGMGGLPLGRRNRLGPGGRVKVQDELCVVCGDRASGYHYNALTCEGCKGFFRRSVTKKAVYRCKSGGSCEMDMYMRRKCQDCRLRKCRAVGMLAECLLTEVQCQSKRLRKGTKARGVGLQEEEDGTDSSRRVSSTSRLQGQVLSASLSREQKLVLDRMVEAHRQYRAQNTHNRMFDWPCANDEEDGLSEVMPPHLEKLLQFSRTVPGFDLLDVSDQSALLSSCSLEVMFLMSAQQFSHNPTAPSPALQPFSISTHDWPRSLETTEKLHSETTSFSSDVNEDFLGPVFNFFHSMRALRVTEAEYVLLTATALLCSDRAPLHVTGCVESMQEVVLELLSRVCGPQGGGAGPQRFGRLLGRLTELRTLRHNHLLLLQQQP